MSIKIDGFRFFSILPACPELAEGFGLLLVTCYYFCAIIIVSMNKFRKLVLSFLSFLILFTSSMTTVSAPKTLAQETFPWYDQSFPQWYKKVYDEQTSPPQEVFGERYTAAQVQWVIYSLASFPIRVGGQAIAASIDFSNGQGDPFTPTAESLSGHRAGR